MMPDVLKQMLSNLIPVQNLPNSPDEVAQMLLNSGKVNQMQVNQAKQMWNQPQVRQMIQNYYKF